MINWMAADIRTAGKAIIIEDGRLLTTVNQNTKGTYYMVPGGGQEHGESLADCVRRECLEEIGAHVSVGQLLHVREFLGDVEQQGGVLLKNFHQVEFFFQCDLLPGEQPVLGSEQDPLQTGTQWVELSRLDCIRFYPEALVPLLQGKQEPVVYLGAVT